MKDILIAMSNEFSGSRNFWIFHLCCFPCVPCSYVVLNMSVMLFGDVGGPESQ